MTLDLLAALLLAHLVADYPLQANWMAHNKHDQADAMTAHVLVHGFVTFVVVWLATGEPVTAWAAAAFVTLAHWLIDIMALHIRWDQTAHLATLIAIWGLLA